MSSKASRGYDALKASGFAALEEQEFEDLCEQLVRRELLARHGAGINVESNRGKSIAGFDLRYRSTTPPTKGEAAFRTDLGAEPLTADATGRYVAYSFRTGRTQTKKAKAEASKLSDWAVDALLGGGHFFLMLSGSKTRPLKAAATRGASPAKAKLKPTSRGATPAPPAPSGPKRQADLRRDLADAYFARLKQLDPQADDPHDRVHVIDAVDLCAYLRGTGYTIGHPLREKLGVPAIPRTHDLAGFTRVHQTDRRGARPRFYWDAQREGVADALLDVLATDSSEDPFRRIVRFVSPPGVGKTRLVVETLTARAEQRGQSLECRVFATTNVADALAALDEHDLLRTYRDAILIVDDVAHDEVGRLITSFAGRNQAREAALIAITAASPAGIPAHASAGPSTLVTLDPGRDEACDLILRGELGEDPKPRLSLIVRGYPWFALIVARELARNHAAPSPQTRSEAVDIALCQRGSPDFSRDVRKRGAALAVVMLLEGSRMEDLTSAERAEILDVFGGEFASWPEVRETVDACAERGLVRPGAGGAFKYVTPAIVELEIAERWLAPAPPEPPLRSRLKTDRMKWRLQRTVERLQQLGLPPQALAELAQPLAALLESARHLSDLSALSGSEMMFAARFAPQRVARALRAVIETTGDAELGADRRHRRSLVFALESTGGRKGAFEDSEAALFPLARTENETYGNNATAVWASLFDVALNTTYLSFQQRLSSLEARLRDPRPDGRRVALAAVERVLSSRAAKLLGEPQDGPYPTASMDELRGAMRTCWRLAAEAMRDPDLSVSTHAASVVAKSLRQGVRHRLVAAMATELAGGPTELPGDGVRRIREAIELAEAHDREWLVGDEVAWASLRSRFAPRGFSDRLRQLVGTWGPATLRGEVGADRQLAAEGLSGPVPLLNELDWLASREAVRAVPFASAAAHVDAKSELLEPLMDRAAAAPELISAYLMGLAETGRDEDADAALARLRKDDACRRAAAASLWRIGVSPRRLEWLIADIESGRLDGPELARFGTGGWAQRLSDHDLSRLVEVLVNVGSDPTLALSLDLLERRLRSPSDDGAKLGEALATVFALSSPRLVTEGGHLAYVWSRAADMLLRRGMSREVARSAVAAINATEPMAVPNPEMAEVLSKVAVADSVATWGELRVALERVKEVPWSLALACREANVTRALQVRDVEQWIGKNGRRARMLAEMISMHETPEVPELARLLLDRFGADSEVAAVLLADLGAARRAVSSLAEFAERQLRKAEQWLSDTNVEVRRFAEKAVASFLIERDEYAAREEYERRRWGT